MELNPSATILLLTVVLCGSAQAGDAERGAQVFRDCSACHSVIDETGTTLVRGGRTGPNLYAVVGRHAGSVPGFHYSTSMVAAGQAGLRWNEEDFVVYVKDATAFLRDYLGAPAARSNMPFHLADPQARRDVIAYLATTEQAATVPPSPEMKDPTLGLEAGPDEVCVANAAQKTHYFAAEGDSGVRRTATLEPGEKLCSPATTDGMVSAFKDSNAFEGCSRLVEAGQMERLRRYVSFDRCSWSSNM